MVFPVIPPSLLQFPSFKALNFAGLRFVIRLQLLLMLFLGLAIGDFLAGALLFTPQDSEAGIGPLSRSKLAENWESHYSPANCTISQPVIAEISNGAEGEGGETSIGHTESFFSVFGVLFANFIGVLAGKSIWIFD